MACMLILHSLSSKRSFSVSAEHMAPTGWSSIHVNCVVLR